MAAVAAAGYAKNLRHDIFYKVQEFSFKNIDHFSTSGLVTRMTTDITNVQMAYMMSIRLLARAPIMVLLSWVMTLMINVKNRAFIPDRDPSSWRNPYLYCQKSPSPLRQGV